MALRRTPTPATTGRSAKTRPARVTEFDQIVRQIRENLRTCPHTSSAEKALFRSALRTVVATARGSTDSSHRVNAVTGRLHYIAEARKLYLRGPDVRFARGSYLVHAKLFVRFTGIIQNKLAEVYDLDTAETLTNNIVAELVQAEPRRTFAIATVSQLPLHTHGTPFWVADSSSGIPPIESAVSLYPVRAGLAPLSSLDKYVLIRFNRDEGRTPRFADSGGNHFWRPGGKTVPLDQCPDGYSGFDEAVVDQVRLGELVAPIVTFDRTL